MELYMTVIGFYAPAHNHILQIVQPYALLSYMVVYDCHLFVFIVYIIWGTQYHKYTGPGPYYEFIIALSLSRSLYYY